LKTLYVTDLDGTLLRNDKSISDFTVDTLNRLIDEGNLITYASARSFVSSKKLTERIHFQLPVITRNGSVFASHVEDKEIEIARFSEDNISKLKVLLSEVIDSTGFLTSYINGQMSRLFRKENLTEGLNRYLQEHANDKNMISVEKGDELCYGTITYITMIAKKEDLQATYEKVKALDDWECNFQKDTYSDDFWLEICPKNSTKAKAVLKHKNQLNCDRLVVFGDGVNDLSMFEVADEACAVMNASEEVKNHASKVILSNEEDGVADFILKDQGN